MDNIFIRRDPAGNIKPDKEKSTEKIDGAVAMIMALDRAIRCGNDMGDSIYDSRDMLVLQYVYCCGTVDILMKTVYNSQGDYNEKKSDY